MQVEITRNTSVNGEHLAAGAVVDLAKRDALTLITLGKAKPVETAPAPEPEPEDEDEDAPAKPAKGKK